MAKKSKFDYRTLIKLHATVFGFLGLVTGVLYSVCGFFYDATAGELGSGTALAFMALVGMPFLFAVAGIVLGIVEAAVISLLRSWPGKLPFKFE